MEVGKSAGELLAFVNTASNNIKTTLNANTSIDWRGNCARKMNHRKYLQKLRAAGDEPKSKRIIENKRRRRRVRKNEFRDKTVDDDVTTEPIVRSDNIEAINSELFEGSSEKECGWKDTSLSDLTQRHHDGLAGTETVTSDNGGDCLLEYLDPSSPFENLLTSPTWKQIVNETTDNALRFQFPPLKDFAQSEIN